MNTLIRSPKVTFHSGQLQLFFFAFDMNAVVSIVDQTGVSYNLQKDPEWASGLMMEFPDVESFSIASIALKLHYDALNDR